MNRSNLLAAFASAVVLAAGSAAAQDPVTGGASASVAPSARKAPAPKTEAQCTAKGGQWIWAGPQNVVKYCDLQTTEGGKACTTSAQCQSECVEHPTGNTCAARVNGCFSPTGRGTVTQCVN